MIFSKKLLYLIILMCILSVLKPKEVQAFQSASHYALIQRVVQELPKDSVIKKSIMKYPDIAAWGAVAPDLGYFQPSQFGGYTPWADRYHYYKVGTYAAEQLKEALDSGDYKKIAFAAGWVSHVSGDLACHGIYVNPEAQVFMENKDGRGLHSELEKNAEPYVWAELGGLPIGVYEKKYLSYVFSHVEDIPFDLIRNTSESVYKVSPSNFKKNQWCNVLRTCLNTGLVGYSYTTYDESIDFLNENGRKERLDKAFLTAKDQCVKLLNLAENKDFSKFTDRWNLDVGSSNSPISSFTVIIKTGSQIGAGTNDDIYFGIKLKTGETKEWKLDKDFYDDFESGDEDEYYLYINDSKFLPSSVSEVWLEKKSNKNSMGNSWYVESLNIDVNGENALWVNPNKWVEGNDTLRFDTNWSNINNVVDPEF